MDTVCPKLSEKAGVPYRSFLFGYTIKDYLTLGNGFLFAASGKLAPFREKQKARIRAQFIIQKPSLACKHADGGFLNYNAAMQHVLLFPMGLKQPSRGE